MTREAYTVEVDLDMQPDEMKVFISKVPTDALRGLHEGLMDTQKRLELLAKLCIVEALMRVIGGNPDEKPTIQ